MNRQFFLYCLLCVTLAVKAQGYDTSEEVSSLNLGKNIHYGIELQGAVADDKTPLWLHSNRYGLSSLDKTNGYMRASIIRPLRTDSIRKWGVGYGIDVAAAMNHTANVIVQQAFVEARWLHGTLSLGSKEYPMELKNNQLSSGSQTLGINARPVPQVRLALADYWTLPFANGWLQMKGHVAFGKMTDEHWQHDFSQKKNRYADNVLYHSKAGYLKIGNEDSFFPLSVEMGLEMATLFGGTSYLLQGDGSLKRMENRVGLKGFWNAFMPGGYDVTEEDIVYQNVEGDQLGSWLLRLNYDAETWTFRVYGEKFFEDHSGMFQLDYDGYGTGENWNVKEKRKYFLYDFKDMLLGAELNLKYGSWLQNIVFEYLYTKYQSGPLYHDHTPNLKDHISGQDNFYNHHIYTGWQHWGQVIGNPLYKSPIYNENGALYIENNRFKAFHLGVSGEPVEKMNYRILATYQEGFGTYARPYTKKRHHVGFLAEAGYGWKGWKVTGSYAMDFGSILGHSCGFQLKLSKRGIFNL